MTVPANDFNETDSNEMPPNGPNPNRSAEIHKPIRSGTSGSINHPSRGAVFVNTLSSGDVRFEVSFNNGPAISIGPVKASDWMLGPMTPFCTTNVSATVLNATSNEVITSSFTTNDRVQLVWLSEFSVVIIPTQVIHQHPQISFNGAGNALSSGSSTAGVSAINFNPPSSPYKYLWIDGIFQEHSFFSLRPLNFAPGVRNLLQYTADMSATLTYTGVLYQLCDSNTNTSNCQSFNSPYLGELQPGENIYVFLLLLVHSK